MTSAGQARGRKRDSRVDQALIAATQELLLEVGYAKLTVDAIAARAGVGKAAIYRRYATKQEMTFAAAIHDLTLEPPPDTGSLRGDLVALIEDIVSSLANGPAAAAVPGLLADIHGDPALTARFLNTFVALERTYIVGVLKRAQGRGEIGDVPDPDLVHALLLGTVFASLFLLGVGSDGLAQRLAALVAAALVGPHAASDA